VAVGHNTGKPLHRPDRALPGPRVQSEAKVSTVEYVNRAAARFLEGLPCKSPEEAVQAGFRPIEDWCRILEEERLMAGVTYHPAPERTRLPVVYQAKSHPRARPARPRAPQSSE